MLVFLGYNHKSRGVVIPTTNFAIDTRLCDLIVLTPSPSPHRKCTNPSPSTISPHRQIVKMGWCRRRARAMVTWLGSCISDLVVVVEDGIWGRIWVWSQWDGLRTVGRWCQWRRAGDGVMLQSFRANLLEWGVVWVEYLLVWWWRRKAQICQCCLGRGGSSRRCGDATGDRFFMVVKEREFVEGRVRGNVI